MRHKRAFHLERADAIARAFDDVVRTALKPVIAVRIAPGGIAGVVKIVAERLAVSRFVLLIALKQAVGIVLGKVFDYD